MPSQALKYRQVKDIYDRLHDAGIVQMDLPTWSGELNKLSESHLYDAGLHDSILKRGSVGIDRLLEATGIPQAGKQFGGELGATLGDRPAGERVGGGLGRGVVNFLPLLIPGAGVGATAVRLGGTGLLAGADTYTETGTPAAGVLSGITAAAMPKVAQLGERAVLKRLGATALEGRITTPTGIQAINELVPHNVKQGVLSQLGGQAAAALFGEVGSQAQGVMSGEGLHNPLNIETLLNLTLGQAPFSLVYLSKHGRQTLGGETSRNYIAETQENIARTQHNLDVQAAAEKAKDEGPLPNLNPGGVAPNPQELAEKQLRLSQLRKEKVALTEDPTPQSMAEFNKQSEEEQKLLGEIHGLTGGKGTVGGEAFDGADRINVVGTEHYHNPDTGYRIVKVADDPANVDLGLTPGELVAYSTRGEPAVTPDPLAPQHKISEVLYPTSDLNFRGGEAVNGNDVTGIKKTVNEQGKPVYAISYTKDGKRYLGYSENPIWELHENFGKGFGSPEGTVVKGNQVYSLPTRFMERGKRDYYAEEAAKVAQETVARKAQNPDLPEQPVPLDLVKYRADREELKTLLGYLDKAQTDEELRNVWAWTNNKLTELGYPVLDDALLKGYKETMGTDLRGAIRAQVVKATRSIEFKQKQQVEEQRIADEKVGGIMEARTKEGLGETVPEEHVALANELTRLRENTKIEPARFNRIVADWDARGRVGGIPELEDTLKERQRSSKGKRKDLPSPTTPEAQPINDIKGAIIDYIISKSTGDELPIAERWATLMEGGELSKEFVDGKEAFMKTPEARDMTAEYERLMAKARENNSISRSLDQPSEERIQAGGGFVYSLAPYDPTTRILGGRHVLPKNETVQVKAFKNMAGREGRPLTDVEIAIDKALVPEAFDKDGNVNVGVLAKGLKESGVTLEVKKLGGYGGEAIYTQYQSNIHALDTLDPNWRNYKTEETTGELRQLLEKHAELHQQLANEETRQGDAARYSFLGPKSESDMPGYVEGLIKARGKKLFTHDHFPGQDNVLAFFRGYEETLPDGRKTFHVIEVQSDWAQSQRTKAEQMRAQEREAGVEVPREGYIQDRVKATSHPLLPLYETLALKAAIQHAREIGADAIVLSDAETAMMTEGHDKVAQGRVEPTPENVAVAKRLLASDDFSRRVQADFKVLIDGQMVDHLQGAARDQMKEWGFDVKITPTQEGGMRLHYDRTLPSALEKLTGEKGEVVGLGVHDKGVTRNAEEQAADFGDDVGMTAQLMQMRGEPLKKTVQGSPVFRNASGQPKTQITGRLYPLAKPFDTLSKQGGFTLTEPSRMLVETLGESKPFVPTTQSDIAKLSDWGVKQGGAGLANFLTRSLDPTISTLAKTLLRYPELLKRVTAEVWDSDFSRAGLLADGRVGLILDSGLLASSGPWAERTLLHELLHGMTKSEVHNPTKTENLRALDELRQRLVESLSPIDRAAYQRAADSNWMARWQNGLARPEELHRDPAKREILYGLLDNNELITQGFTAPGMREFMQGVKGKGGNTWNVFKNWVKELLGLGEVVKGTAFEDFLEHTSNVLSQGEHIATAKNYAERYFENLGYTETERDAAVRRTLGVLQEQHESPKALLETAVLSGLPRGERYQQLAQENQDLNDPVMAELGYGSGTKGLDDLAIDGALGTVSNLEDVLALLPDSAAQYVFESNRDVKKILGAVAGAQQNAGDVGAVNSGFGKEAIKLTNRLSRLEKQHEVAKAQILGMVGIGGEGLVSRMLNNPEETKKIAPKEDPGFMSKIERVLALPAQIARQSQTFAQHFAMTAQVAGNARKMRDDALESMATDSVAETLAQAKEFGVNIPAQDLGGRLSKESQERTEKVLSTPKLTKAANGWIYENQKANRGAEVVLPPNDPQVLKHLKGLTPDETNLVYETLQKASVAVQRTQAQNIGMMKERAYVQGIKLLGRELTNAGVTSSWADRQRLSQTALEAALANFADPMEAAKANATVAQLESSLPPAAFNQLMAHVTNARDMIQAWQESYAARPAWISGKDYGRYRAVYVDKTGKAQRVASDDRNFVENEVKKGKLVDGITDRGNTDDEPVHWDGLGPEQFARIQELERHQWDIQGLTDEEKNQRASIANQIAREIQVQGGQEGIPSTKRNLSRGAESLPWLSNLFSYIGANSNYQTRKLYREQHEAIIAEPEVQNNKELKKYIQDYFNGYMAKDPELAQTLKRATATWFLGANMASALANPIGNAMRVISELTAVSGKSLQSYSRYTDAASDVLANWSGKKGWNTPEEGAVMEEAARRGFRDYSLHDDNAIAQDTLAQKYKQLIDGQRPVGLGKRLSTLAGNLGNASMWMFRMGDRFSSTLAILSSYRLYREQGLSHTAAQEKAFEFSHSVNDSGGRANRAVGPFSTTGEIPRSAALLGTTLQNFVLGSTFQLVRYLKKGLYRPAGLTPGEVFASRKAALQMLSMQLGAAGVLGMPFVSGAIALLDKAFPGFELNRKLREGLSAFLDSDGEQGQTLSDISLTGLPSMLGWDLQSRLSMGNTLPGTTEVNGFQPEALFGPALGLVGQFVKGGQRLVSGQGKPSDWTPPAIKKLTQLVSSSGVGSLVGNSGSVLDYKDRPILNDLTPGEKLGITLGFNPKRLSDFNAAQRVTDQADEVVRQRQSQFFQQQAESVLAGKFGNVRLELQKMSSEQPQFDPVEAVRKIAEQAEALTFPRDLRREGTGSNSGVRTRLLDNFPLSASGPTERDRLLFRQQIEQRLGVRGSRTYDMIKAELMDKLKMQNPNATRSDLRRAAEAALVRSRRQTELLPQESLSAGRVW